MVELELVNLTKEFVGGFRLGPLNLKVSDNKILVIVGPTGSGKTTILNLISGLLEPDSGSILVDGIDITNVPVESRSIGYTFQNPSLFPHMNVYENIIFGIKGKWRYGNSNYVETNKLLVDLGISQLVNRRVDGLSGGEAQKVSLARMLITKPKIMLMDEPLAHLDPTTKRKLRIELRYILKRQSTPTICVTHFEDDVYALADSVCVLQNGIIEHSSELGSFLMRRQYEHSIPSSLSDVLTGIQGNNYIEGKVMKSIGGLTTFKSGSTLLETLGHYSVGTKVGMLIRPEDIILSKEMIKTSARNVVKSKVAKITKHDAGIVDVFIVGDTFHLTSRITEEARIDLGISQDDDVFAIFKASSPQVVREEQNQEE
ncbi:MAG TPA: ABC transporter ATP-binding protein [Nitrososphaeraceae archaeon]|nr:ABC transporter ATP-binding protein [Nitrososphaeraceae archaeon]